MSSQPAPAPDVPAKVFTEFVEQTAQNAFPADVVKRLRSTLLDTQNFSDEGLRAALFGEEEET